MNSVPETPPPSYDELYPPDQGCSSLIDFVAVNFISRVSFVDNFPNIKLFIRELMSHFFATLCMLIVGSVFAIGLAIELFILLWLFSTDSGRDNMYRLTR